MILWIVAVLLLGLVGMVGYYQGAVRATMSFFGLIVGAALAVPLGNALGPILKLVGLKHPVFIALIGPLVVFVVILIAFKVGGLALHRKLDGYYKYQGSDTKRLLFERMNQRVGIAVGVLNAVVYVMLLAGLFYVLGYFTVQMATTANDPFTMKLVSRVAQDVQSTSLHKALGPFIMAKERYFDAVDAMGTIFHNPVVQNRLATYPPFLPISDRQEFKELGNDVKFQEFWLKGPSYEEFKSHPKIAPLVQNIDLYTNVLATLNGDYKDLNTWLQTGKSEKFGDEKIIGRWEVDLGASMAHARKSKPNITTVELRWLRRSLLGLSNATFVAFLDNKARLRLPMTNGVQNLQGTWQGSGNSYRLSFTDGKRKVEFPATVEGNKLAVSKDNLTLLFDK